MAQKTKKKASTKKRSTSRRDTVKLAKGTTKYAKRTTRGQFKEMDEKGLSLAARKTVKGSHGARGDQERRRAS